MIDVGIAADDDDVEFLLTPVLRLREGHRQGTLGCGARWLGAQRLQQSPEATGVGIK